jgi:uncharacterized protein (TIGR02996 family)
MTDEDSFLRAITAAPDDDLPRLVYADWLDEHGRHERAEFIRLQCELARLPEGNARHNELRTREHDLLTAHGAEWLGGLRALNIRAARSPEEFSRLDVARFRRGWVDGLLLRGNGFLRHGEALYRAAPLLRHIQLDGAGLAIQEEGFLPLLDRLTSLDLGCNDLSDWDVQLLAACPHVARLDTLDLGGNDLGPEAARALAASPHLPRLGVLALNDNEVGDTGAEALADSALFPRLTTLDLSNNDLSPATQHRLRARFGDGVRF